MNKNVWFLRLSYAYVFWFLKLIYFLNKSLAFLFSANGAFFFVLISYILFLLKNQQKLNPISTKNLQTFVSLRQRRKRRHFRKFRLRWNPRNISNFGHRLRRRRGHVRSVWTETVGDSNSDSHR